MYQYFIIATITAVAYHSVYIICSSLFHIKDLQFIHGIYRISSNTLSLLSSYVLMAYHGKACTEPETSPMSTVGWLTTSIGVMIAMEIIIEQLSNLYRSSHDKDNNKDTNQDNTQDIKDGQLQDPNGQTIWIQTIAGLCGYIIMVEYLQQYNAALAVSGMTLYIFLDPCPRGVINNVWEKQLSLYALVVMTLMRIIALACMACGILHPRSSLLMRLYSVLALYGIIMIDAWWLKETYKKYINSN